MSIQTIRSPFLRRMVLCFAFLPLLVVVPVVAGIVAAWDELKDHLPTCVSAWRGQ